MNSSDGYKEESSATRGLGNSGKIAYSTPRLELFGSIRTLTQSGAGSMTEAGDGMGGCSNNGARMSCLSDRSTKENIVRVGTHPMGFGLYLFDYKAPYQAANGSGRQFGAMADEVEAIVPAAVSLGSDSLKRVNYDMLGIGLAIH